MVRLAMTHLNARGSGITTALVDACRHTKSVMVCNSIQEAQRIEDTYNIEAISIGELKNRFPGSKESYIWDHHTNAFYISGLEDNIINAESKLKSRDNDVLMLEIKLKAEKTKNKDLSDVSIELQKQSKRFEKALSEILQEKLHIEGDELERRLHDIRYDV